MDFCNGAFSCPCSSSYGCRTIRKRRRNVSVSVMPSGDRALIVEFGRVIDEAVNTRVQQLADVLDRKKPAGVLECVPTYRSLLVLYDPMTVGYESLKNTILKLVPSEGEARSRKKTVLQIPCCYGGEYGPDLEEMQQICNLSSEEIVRLHSGQLYKIYMLGFLPGFVYLGGMDSRIAAPRLSVPRTLIPAGSVGIGGSQTGVYPIASPGGWRLIGSTPVRFYDPDRINPILCRAGEYIRFIAVTPKEYAAIARDVSAGTYTVSEISVDS